jgi:hypothetical protein
MPSSAAADPAVFHADLDADRHSGRHLSGRVRRVSKFASFTRFMTDIMLSAPSIVIGLFVYALFVATRAAILRLGRRWRWR